MKRVKLIAALLALGLLPAPGQAQGDKPAAKPAEKAAAPATKAAEKPAAPATKADAKPAAAAAPTPPAAKPVEPPANAPVAKPAEKPAEAQVASAAPRSSRAHVDARECLKHDTNRAVMVCAEKFR